MTREVFPKHAAARAVVVLDDGRTGVVLWLYRHTGRAKVRVGGRHVVVPVESLRLAPEGPLTAPDRPLESLLTASGDGDGGPAGGFGRGDLRGSDGKT